MDSVHALVKMLLPPFLSRLLNNYHSELAGFYYPLYQSWKCIKSSYEEDDQDVSGRRSGVVDYSMMCRHRKWYRPTNAHQAQTPDPLENSKSSRTFL